MNKTKAGAKFRWSGKTDELAVRLPFMVNARKILTLTGFFKCRFLRENAGIGEFSLKNRHARLR